MNNNFSIFRGGSSKRGAAKRGVSMIQEERSHILSTRSDFFLREAYKTLRTNVSFSLTGEEKSKMIMVTSSYQSEGKSITSVNLAISFAQQDQKVIVVECDLRRPKLGRLLQLRTGMGLSNVLMKPELLNESIAISSIPNLDVLTAGDIPPNPSELLSSGRMQRLLQTLRGKYDYVILDTPPVNMVIDAVVLAPQCDGVLFVVHANSTERGAVMHAVNQLEYAKAKIIGFVLNAVDLESTNYGYGKYRYSRRYGYRSYGRKPYSYRNHGYGYKSYGYGYSAFSQKSGQGQTEGNGR